MPNPTLVLTAIQDCFGQLDFVLSNLPEGTYTRRCELAMNGTIGAHVRHTLDHFEAILTGYPDGQINYDQRKRKGPVECSPVAARDLISTLQKQWQDFAPEDLSLACEVRSQCHEQEAPVACSTYGREVIFAISHAIHHNALICCILNAFSLPIPEGFGVAPSTLQYQKRELNSR